MWAEILDLDVLLPLVKEIWIIVLGDFQGYTVQFSLRSSLIVTVGERDE